MKSHAESGFLETQIDLQKKEERRLREQSRELEKARLGTVELVMILVKKQVKILKETDMEKMKDFLTLGLATSLSGSLVQTYLAKN